MPVFTAVLKVDECEGVSRIEPAAGRTWGVRCRCGSCGEEAHNFVYVDEADVHMNATGGLHQCTYKCRFCQNTINVDVVAQSHGSYDSATGSGAIVQFDVRGGEPVALELDDQWVVHSDGGARFAAADLSSDWCEYDEANATSLSVMGAHVDFARPRKK